MLVTGKLPRGLGACALIAACISLTAPALAQQVIARVNGDPITAVDLAQRSKLIEVSTHKAPARQDVLNELIDEKLKLQTLQRYRQEITDAEVDATFAVMAQRMRATPQKFTEALAHSGISASALKRKIRADLAWQQIVRGKFQASLQVRERDVATVLESRKKDQKDLISYEYTLQPILLMVPPNSGDAVIEGRRREAEGLRTRFADCDEGLRLARGLRDVVIRPPITRSSGDLTAKLREVIDSTPIGKLTPPDVTPQGVEVFALCGKKQAKGDAGAARDVREELFSEKYQALGKKYLEELRRDAKVETY
jgi:peptidyl-prolyl cis-trans isomerase SurA